MILITEAFKLQSLSFGDNHFFNGNKPYITLHLPFLFRQYWSGILVLEKRLYWFNLTKANSPVVLSQQQLALVLR